MDWTCIICLDVFENSGSVCCAPCGHIFHESCLVPWFQESRTCPQCRKTVRINGNLKLYPNVSSEASSPNPSATKNCGNNVKSEEDGEIGRLKSRNLELVEHLIIAESEASEFRQQKLELENKVKHIQLQLDHSNQQANRASQLETVCFILRKEISNLKSQANRASQLEKECLILGKEISNLQSQANRASQLEKECLILRKEIEEYKNYKKIVLETQTEDALMVKTELGTAVDKLETHICTLKKNLDTIAKEKNSLYNGLINLKTIWDN